MKLTTIKLSAFTLIFLFGLAGCDNPNSGVNDGKQVDQAVQDAEKKMYESSDAAGDASDKAGVQMDDATITTKIKAAFLAETMISSLDINVNTMDGVVTLTGSADSLASSQKAAEIAGNMAGVKNVENELVIK